MISFPTLQKLRYLMRNESATIRDEEQEPWLSFRLITGHVYELKEVTT